MKAQVQFVEANDGIFFMSLNNFRYIFDTFSCSQIHDDYIYASIQASQKDRESTFNVFEFEVSEEGEYFLSVV